MFIFPVASGLPFIHEKIERPGTWCTYSFLLIYNDSHLIHNSSSFCLATESEADYSSLILLFRTVFFLKKVGQIIKTSIYGLILVYPRPWGHVFNIAWQAMLKFYTITPYILAIISLLREWQISKLN